MGGRYRNEGRLKLPVAVCGCCACVIWFRFRIGTECHACKRGVFIHANNWIFYECPRCHGAALGCDCACRVLPSRASRCSQRFSCDGDPSRTRRTVQASRFPTIVLEITEHSVVKDYDNLLAGISRLHQLGVRLAIDDASAGFASLWHILRLKPDLIKLDASLTRRGRKQRSSTFGVCPIGCLPKAAMRNCWLKA
jgi:hypothetical protein